MEDLPIDKRTGAEIARLVGYVFEDPEKMFFARSVDEEIAFGPKNLGFTRDQVLRLVAGAIEITGLGDLKQKNPFSLSYGEQKRLALACILAMQNKVLILDDLFAGLEFNSGIMLMERILHSETVDAILFSTQDLDLVRRVADRVYILNNGRVVQEGSVEECLDDPVQLAAYRLHPQESPAI